MTCRPRLSHVALAAVLAWASPVARSAPEDPAPAAPGAAAQPTASEVRQDPDPDALERRDRRARAGAAMDADAVLLVLAAGPSPGFSARVRSDDFHYVCPFDAASGAVVLFHDGDTLRHHVYLEPRRAFAERWNGPTTGPGDDTATRYAFDQALPLDRLVPDLAGLLAKRRTLLVSAQSPSDGSERLEDVLAAVGQGLLPDRTLARADGARRGPAPDPADASQVVVESASPRLTELRAVKSEAEIERVQAAVEATVLGLLDAGRAIAPGVAEYQVEALVELRCRLAGCERQAFPSIVGSGPNSCILHYTANRRVMQAGDLVVVDVGGEMEGYAADVTRTFPVSGTFTPRQAEVYDAVLAAQKAGIAAARPGATLRDVHMAAKAVLAERGLDRWFIHGTSHSVGLNVHDAWSSKRALEVGSILTVEPGVYIPDEELGVRIEDTVLVTEDGVRILSHGAPKERAEVERLMREDCPVELPPPR